jgi:hypothetical protein
MPTKVNKIIIFNATKDFTCFHWIIHDHVIHELYCLFYLFKGLVQKLKIQLCIINRDWKICTENVQYMHAICTKKLPKYAVKYMQNRLTISSYFLEIKHIC